MTIIRSSIFIVFLEKYATISIQFVTSIIVARILTPHEMGIYSLAVSFTVLLHVFRDLGVGQYLVQEENLSIDRMKSALFILYITSALLGSITILSRHAVADFYREPGIADLLIILGFNFYLLPFGALVFASWRRKLNFRMIAIVNILSVCSSSLITLYFAQLGKSYMSLAWGSFAGNLITIIFCLIYSNKSIPILPNTKEISRVFSYTSYATLTSLLQSVGERLGALLLGRLSTMSLVGLYERANGLGEIFIFGIMQGVWSIAMPAFAANIREGKDVKESYVYSTGLISGLGFAFYSWLFIFANPIVMLLLGTNWAGVTPLLQLVCLRQSIGIPNSLSGSLIVAHGKVKLNMYITLVLQGMIILGIVIGSPYGPSGILWASSGTWFIANLWLVICIRRLILIRKILTQVLISSLSILLPSSISGLIMYSEYNLYIQDIKPNILIALCSWLSISNYTSDLVWSLTIGSLAYLFYWIISLNYLHHPIWIEVTRLSSNFFTRTKALA
jgi:O-antigen/teichoic acid export membrane protein